MSLLHRLQDLLGLNGEFGPYDDDSEYVDPQQDGAAYVDGRANSKRRGGADNVIEMPGLGPMQSELVVMEPRSFEDVPEAILALRERKSIVLNLSYMDADQAQRSVDYIAGGVFALDGHQERIGKSVFLFTPSSVQISSYPPPFAGVPYAPASFHHAVAQPSREQAMLEQLEIKARHAQEAPRSDIF